MKKALQRMSLPILNFNLQGPCLLCTHQDPDPDGAGALLALWHFGKEHYLPFFACIDHFPNYMNFMPGIEELQNALPRQLPDSFTLIALDCGQKSRIWPQSAVEKAENIWNLDHHIDNDAFGAINWVEPDASSTCEMLYTLMESQGIDRILPVSQNLLAGIVFDTGGLRFPNVSMRTMEVAIQLMKDGACLSTISDQVFSRWTRKSFKTLMLALQHLDFFFQDQFLLSWIDYASVQHHQLGEEDFEGVVQTLAQHCSARIVVLIREMEPGVFRGSLRSKKHCTVHDIAQLVGGGGHKLAAGFSTSKCTARELRNLLILQAESKLQ